MSTSADLLNEIISGLGIEDYLTDSQIDTIINDYAYKGIDIKEMLITLKARTQTREEKRRFMMLVTIGLARGNNLTAIGNSIGSSESKKIFDEAIKHFVIRSTITSDRKTCFTLSRLRVLVPNVAAKVLINERLTRPVSLDKLKADYNLSTKFPAICRDMSIASLIPGRAQGVHPASIMNRMLTIIYAYCLSEAKVLWNKPGKPFDYKQVAADTRKFLEVTWRTDHIAMDKREVFFVQYFIFFGNVVSVSDEIKNSLSLVGIEPIRLIEQEEESDF